MVAVRSGHLDVCETFTSIQGEGSHAGLPCFFIRLAGCNLRCAYCDTTYAYKGGIRKRVEELVREWMESRVRYVLLTGGEPLIQEPVYTLMEQLISKGAICLLETNGSISLARVPKAVKKVVDWKTPGSGHEKSFLIKNLRYIGVTDEIKFVITSREDYIWSSQIIVSKLLWLYTNVILSPCYGRIVPAELAEWMLKDRLNVRLQLQLHKVIWGEKRGV